MCSLWVLTQFRGQVGCKSHKLSYSLYLWYNSQVFNKAESVNEAWMGNGDNDIMHIKTLMKVQSIFEAYEGLSYSFAWGTIYVQGGLHMTT